MENSNESEFVTSIKATLEKLQEEIRTSGASLGNFDDLESTAKELADSATEFIRKYPVPSVAGAAVLGFVLGAFVNRNKT